MLVNIISEERIFDDYIKVDKARLTHELSDGQTSKEMERSVVVRKDAVVATVYNTTRKTFIFVRQFRYAVYKHGEEPMLETPAGVIDDNETPEQAVVRELKEEIHEQPTKIDKIATIYTSPGYTTERFHMFYAEIENPNAPSRYGGLDHEDEHLEIVEMPLEEAKHALEQGRFKDSKTLTGVLWVLHKVTEVRR